MSTDTDTLLVARRAELLAEFALTSRKGVEVIGFPDPDDSGIDLMARLPSLKPSLAGKNIQPYLCVQVKGTAQPLESEVAASAFARRL